MKNVYSNLRKQKDVGQILVNSYYKQHHIIFIDKISFNESQSVRNGYAKKGKSPVNFKFSKYSK